MSTYNFFKMLPGEQINQCIADLPKAEEFEIFNEKNEKLEYYKGIRVNGQVVDIPTKYYVLKQHDESFRPIIDGLTVRGISDFKFTMWSTLTRASINILVGEAVDGVKFGFKCTNSFDRTTAISFGFRAFQKQETVHIVEKEHVLIWGFRQVCSNGMVVKVPLKTTKYLDAVTITKIKELLSHKTHILHMGSDVDEKLKAVQYVVEAFILLKNPLDAMIIDAQNMSITPERAKVLIEKYVGRRKLDTYLEQFGMEDQTLWGLYNTLTFIASHQADKMTENMRESLLMKAANLLEGELVVNV